VMDNEKGDGDGWTTPTFAHLEISSRILPGSVLKLECPTWADLRSENVCAHTHKREFSMILRQFNQKAVKFVWDDLPEPVASSEFTVDVVEGAILVDFLDKPAITVFLTKKARVLPDTSAKFHACRVDAVEKLNYNTVLLKVSLPSKLVMPVPTGHHVSIRMKKGSNLLSRPYTPIQCTNRSGLYELTFMIKIYRLGIFTPEFLNISAGNCIDISDPIGRIDFDRTILDSEVEDVVCFAAGTGITPMIRIVEQRFKHLIKGSTTVWWFNRTEDDILKDDQFPVTFEGFEHILSEPTELWKGRKGRINQKMVQEAVEDKSKFRVYVCGPEGFNEEAVRLLADAGVDKRLIHVYQG